MGKTKSVRGLSPLFWGFLFVIAAMVGSGLEWGKARWQWRSHSPEALGQIKMEEQRSNLSSVPDVPQIVVSPKHKEVLAQPPETIGISFEFPVSRVKLSLTKDGKDIKGEPPDFSEDGKTLSLPFPKDAGSGIYAVNYNLCSEPEECIDGSFEFTVE